MQTRVILPKLLLIAAILFGFNTAVADEAAQLKTANDALRQAQNAMFSGKIEEASLKLADAEEAITALKGENPNSPQLKTLENKVSKLKSDIERRTSTPAAKSTASAAATPSSSQAPALPRNTREAHRLIEREIQALETTHKTRLERVLSGESTEGDASFVTQSVQRRIKEAGELLASLEDAAGKDNASGHPTVVAMKKRVQAVTKSTQQLIDRVMAAGATPEPDAADLTAMQELLEHFRTDWHNPIVNLSYESDLDKVTEAWHKLNQFNKEVRPSIQSRIDAFASKYGSDRDTIEEALGESAPGIAWSDIQREMKRLDSLPSEIHVRVMDQLQNMLSGLDGNHDFFRLQRHIELLATYEIARATAADPSAVPDVPAIVAADTKAYMEKINQVEWPECLGNPDTRKGAKAYLIENWEKDPKHNYTLLGFAITGDWSVQSRTLGAPTSYGIPVKVALQEPQDKEAGLARVFDLTLRTEVSDKPEKTPPFVSDTVGNSWYILASKVKMPTG